MELSDLEWGDVVSDDDGVLFVRAALVLASRADATPAWAQDSLDWLRGRP